MLLSWIQILVHDEFNKYIDKKVNYRLFSQIELLYQKYNVKVFANTKEIEVIMKSKHEGFKTVW